MSQGISCSIGRYLIIGGGGAGQYSGAGGGAGGFVEDYFDASIVPGVSLDATVGIGGSYTERNGGDSSIGRVIAYGGGASASSESKAHDGGSGGGGYTTGSYQQGKFHCPKRYGFVSMTFTSFA